MAYQIDRYSNTILAVVEDGTVDQTTDLKFIGKNYAGYGEIQNENFLFLLENFAGANEPARPISGQLWFDTTVSKLKFYDGTKWRATGGSETTGLAPTGLAEGDFWWDTATKQLKVYNGTNFTLVGPQVAGLNTTQMQSEEVLDSNGATKSIIKSVVNGVVVSIISSDDFTLNSGSPITGFTTIKKGINLVNSATGITTSTDRFIGTATSAASLLKTDGSVVNVDNLVTATPGVPTEFSTVVKIPNQGLTIGENEDFSLKLTNGEALIGNTNGVNSKIKFSTTDNTGNDVTIAYFNNIGLIPNLVHRYQFQSTRSRGARLPPLHVKCSKGKIVTLR